MGLVFTFYWGLIELVHKLCNVLSHLFKYYSQVDGTVNGLTILNICHTAGATGIYDKLTVKIKYGTVHLGPDALYHLEGSNLSAACVHKNLQFLTFSVTT